MPTLKQYKSLSVILASTLLLSACVSSEQAERNGARAAMQAASKDVVVAGCYNAPAAEVEKAQSLAASAPGRSGNVYWFRSRSVPNTMAAVAANSSLTTTDSCAATMKQSCGALGMEPRTYFASIAQVAANRGEVTATCSPKVDQS